MTAPMHHAPPSAIVCSRCKRLDSYPRLRQGDPCMTCKQCGKRWKALEIPIVGSGNTSSIPSE